MSMKDTKDKTSAAATSERVGAFAGALWFVGLITILLQVASDVRVAGWILILYMVVAGADALLLLCRALA